MLYDLADDYLLHSIVRAREPNRNGAQSFKDTKWWKTVFACAINNFRSHPNPQTNFVSAVEEIEQMNNLFQQKQRELVVAASKVEELNRQLEMLKSGKLDALNDNQGAVAELDRLYRELQVRHSNYFMSVGHK